MRPFAFPLLADENIHSEVVLALSGQGKDVRSAVEEGLAGASDVEVLRRAHSTARVVLTHDSDFGLLAVRNGEPLIGIVFLRPGHLQASFVIQTIAAVEAADIEVATPFFLVAERKAGSVHIRVRTPP